MPLDQPGTFLDLGFEKRIYTHTQKLHIHTQKLLRSRFLKNEYTHTEIHTHTHTETTRTHTETTHTHRGTS